MKLTKKEREKYLANLDNEALKRTGKQILDEELDSKIRKFEFNLNLLKLILALALFGGTLAFITYTLYMTIKAGETMQEKMYNRIHDILGN